MFYFHFVHCFGFAFVAFLVFLFWSLLMWLMTLFSIVFGFLFLHVFQHRLLKRLSGLHCTSFALLLKVSWWYSCGSAYRLFVLFQCFDFSASRTLIKWVLFLLFLSFSFTTFSLIPFTPLSHFLSLGYFNALPQCLLLNINMNLFFCGYYVI